jgi:hypothetical protein
VPRLLQPRISATRHATFGRSNGRRDVALVLHHDHAAALDLVQVTRHPREDTLVGA